MTRSAGELGTFEKLRAQLRKRGNREAQRAFLIESVAVKQEADEEKKWADNHMSAVNIFASDFFSWELAEADRKRIAEEERQKAAAAAAKKAKKQAPKKAKA